METDRPGRRRPAGSWLFLDSESRRQRNHEPRQPEIPKRKKSDIHTRLSCKIDYLLRSNHNDQSIASEFFTGDYQDSEYGSRQPLRDAFRNIWDEHDKRGAGDRSGKPSYAADDHS